MRYDDMDVANSPLELIGHTPMVRLGKVAGELRCDVIAKLETTNPGGSSKDRPALTMIEAAERDGLLGPGSTIIEPTSGNTGVGLAIVAAQRGYKCIFVMSDKMAPEKIDVLRAYGAEVVVCPTAVAPEHPDSYYSTAERLTKETPNSFRPDQYSNPNNPRAHYETTGPEIYEQTRGHVTHFVAGRRHRRDDFGCRAVFEGAQSRDSDHRRGPPGLGLFGWRGTPVPDRRCW